MDPVVVSGIKLLAAVAFGFIVAVLLGAVANAQDHKRFGNK